MSHRHLLLLFVSLIFAVGCSENPSTSQILTGKIWGKNVTLIDYNGLHLANRSGVRIQFDGTPFYAVSDSAGNWSFDNLQTGDYSVTASKDSFLSWKNSVYQYVAGGVQSLNDITLIQPCRYKLILDALIAPTKDSVERYGKCFAHTSADAPHIVSLGGIVCFGKHPNMDPSDTSSFVVSFPFESVTLAPKDSVANFQIPEITYASCSRFIKGDTIFAQAFPIIIGTQFYDVKRNRIITQGYGEGSNILSTIMR